MTRVDETVEHLASVLGPERVSNRLFERFLYSHDLTTMPKLAAITWRATPDVVAIPRTIDDVREILTVARQKALPVTTRGGGSTMFGASVPNKGGILIDMRGLNQILKLDRDAGTIEVQAGATWLDAMNVAERGGLSLPVYPILAPSSTIGGCVASGSTGYGALKCGYPVDWVMSVETVLDDGLVTNVPGLQRDVILSAGGKLGVITKVVFKCLPAPEEIRPLSYSFPTLRKAIEPMLAVSKSSAAPWHVGFYDERHTKFQLILEHSSENAFCEVQVVLVGSKEKVADGEKTVDSMVAAAGGQKIPGELAAKSWSSRFAIYRARRISGGLVALPSMIPSARLAETALGSVATASKMRMNMAMTGFMVGSDFVALTPYYLTDDTRLKSQMALGFIPRFDRFLAEMGGYPQGLGLLNYYRFKKTFVGVAASRTALKQTLGERFGINLGRNMQECTRHKAPGLRKVNPGLTTARLKAMGGLKRLTTADKYDKPPKPKFTA